MLNYEINDDSYEEVSTVSIKFCEQMKDSTVINHVSELVHSFSFLF